MLDRLIKKDAANGELQRDYFDNSNNAGHAEHAQQDFEAAKKSYRAAYEFAQNAPKLKDSPFVKFADGLTRAVDTTWHPARIRAHAERFSRERFVSEIRDIVDDTLNAPAGQQW